jgi:hypothetical protein
MNTITSLFLGIAASVVLSSANAEQHSNDEVSFFEKHAFPFAQKFLLLPQLPFERPIQTNDVLKWRCEYVSNSGGMVGVFLSLTNKKFINLRVSGTNCAVWHFADGQTNPLGIAGRDDPTKAKFYSEQPNRFTLDSALLFTEEFAKAAGENLGSFRLIKSWQITWGDPSDKTNHILLPFYEFQWIEKNVKEPEAGVLYPSIHVIVSGITKKVVSYDRLQMPVVTDDGLRKRYSTNSTEIYTPIPAGNVEVGTTNNTKTN